MLWKCMKLTCVCYFLQFHLTYDLYIAAFAGAGVTLLALVSNCFDYLYAMEWNYVFKMPLCSKMCFAYWHLIWIFGLHCADFGTKTFHTLKGESSSVITRHRPTSMICDTTASLEANHDPILNLHTYDVETWSLRIDSEVERHLVFSI